MDDALLADAFAAQIAEDGMPEDVNRHDMAAVERYMARPWCVGEPAPIMFDVPTGGAE